MGLQEFVSDPRFQSKDLRTKRAMLADYGVDESDFGPLLSYRPKAEAKPEATKSAAQAFVDRGIETAKGLGSLALDAGKSALTLEGQAKFLPRMAANLYEGAVQSGADAIARQFPKGMDNQPENAEFYRSAARGGAAAVPFVGPYVMNAVSDIEEGKGSEVLGRTAFDALTLATPAKAGQVGRATVGAAKSAVPVAVDAAKAVGAAAIDPLTISLATTGASVGGQLAGPVGAVLGGGGVALLKIAPEVYKAVKSGLMARKGISGAQAEAALLKMPAEELAATVQAVVEPPPVAAPVAAPAKASAEQVLQAQNAYKVQQKIKQGKPPARAYSYEQAGLPVPPEVAAAEASRIRPIPPNKLPPVLPDPVVREIAAAPKPVVTPEAPAVAPAVDEAAARAARQKQHIEDSYKAKAEKDAKNVAAEDNLLFDLERSIEHLKKRGPEKPAPSPAQSIAEKVKERVLSMKKQGMSRGQMKSSVLEDILRRQDGYRPSEVQRAVDLVLKEGVDAPPVPKTATKPAEFAAKVAENKTKGADLAAALEESPVPQIDSVRSAIVGKRVYTKEGESAVESAKAEARRVINAEYPDPKTRADAIEEALAKVEQVEHEADKAGRSRVIAKAEMRRITEFSSDPSMAKKQRAYNERLSAYEASRNPSEPQIIDGKIVYVPAPDKRTAMLDTAKAKLKKKPEDAKPKAQTAGFPPIVKGMMEAVDKSLQIGRDKISNVKVKLSPDGSHEVFTFDLDGVPHSAPLKGKTAESLYRQGYLPGNTELDTKIANSMVLDKTAKPVSRRAKE